MIHVDFLQQCIPNKRWPWPSVAHLTCDPTDDFEPLHKFAAAIGLKRSWFQPRGGIMPHYDLTPTKRQQALRTGANELQTRAAVVTLINAWRATRPEHAHHRPPSPSQGCVRRHAGVTNSSAGPKSAKRIHLRFS